jgi:hypothetical protein
MKGKNMSEDNRPRYKEYINIGPDIMNDAGSGAGDSGRNKNNRESRSSKPKRNGRREAWMKK